MQTVTVWHVHTFYCKENEVQTVIYCERGGSEQGDGESTRIL